MSIRKIHNIKKFVEIVKNCDVYVGVDVHKNTYSSALLCPEKMVMLVFSTTNTNSDFVDELKLLNINIKDIVYEAGPTGFALAWSCKNSCRVDDLTGEVIPDPLPVKVISPVLAPQCAAKNNKSDRRDAIDLANLATKPIDLEGCCIAVPTLHEQNLKELSRLRELAVDSRRKSIQRLKSLLLRYGINFPGETGIYTKKVGEILKKIEVSEILHYIICNYIDMIDYCTKDKDEKKKKLDEEIRKAYKSEKEILESIPGVGSVVANTFLSEVFRVTERFTDKDKLAQYCGAAPIIRESGEKSGKISGYLTSLCNVHIQPILVQAAWTFMRKDEIANNMYIRKISRGKKSGTAIMSVVKKLISLMLSLLKNNRKYELVSIS